MNFVSIEFLYLLASVTGLLCLFRGKDIQNDIILVASYLFYGWWDWRFLFLLAFSSCIDFVCGIFLDKDRYPTLSNRKRRLVLWVSLAANLGALGFFKYFNFFFNGLREMPFLHASLAEMPMLEIILPVGISFYTFQSMSYTIDVYRGRIASTSHLRDFLLYVSFFPQLVAGPIERASHLLPQVSNPRSIAFDRVSVGCQLAMIGFFKKMVLADNLAIIANQFYTISNPSGLEVLLGTYAFAFQIYCDFSGYTDIARGVAKIIGFDICRNFNNPYFAVSPSDFWRRWHISLSTWLRDYLYIELGGNRRGSFATAKNLMITMLLGGLWHGANSTFLLWGLYHGILLVVFRVISKSSFGLLAIRLLKLPGAYVIAGVLYFHLTCLGWIFFRANDVAHLRTLFAALSTFSIADSVPLLIWLQLLPFVFLALLFDALAAYFKKEHPWLDWRPWPKVIFYVWIFYVIVIFGSPVSNSFVYFQF